MEKLLKISSKIIVLAGVIMICGGVGGTIYTYRNVVREKIVTPDDAFIPGVAVRGPITLKAQVDIIRKHTLKITGGKTFAEMPRQIQKLNSDGSPIVDKDGKPVMVANTARDIWITSTTLITALNLGIIAYVFSGLAFILGLVFILIGIALHSPPKR